MTRERWIQIEEILAAAFELEARDQPTFLDHACGRDLELRAQVTALVAADQSDDDFLGGAVIGLPGDLAGEDLPNRSPGGASGHTKSSARSAAVGWGQSTLPNEWMANTARRLRSNS